jgi:hypothetical protein
MRAASAQRPHDARGAHVTPYHRPLQPLVMCACHRTSPTATLLACDGLYAATDAEQRGPHDTKLTNLIACRCSSGATASVLDGTQHAKLCQHALSTRVGRTVSSIVRPTIMRRGNEDSTERPEADVAQRRNNAAALAAGQ